MKEKVRIRVVLAAALAMAVLLSGVLANQEILQLTKLKVDTEILVSVISILGALVGLGAFLFNYLTDAKRQELREAREHKKYTYVIEERERNRSLRKLIENHAGKEEISEAIAQKIKSDSIEEYLESIQEKIREQIFEKEQDARREEIRNRIYREIEALNRRGTVNLVLGIVTAIVGIVVMLYFVIIDANSYSGLTDFAVQFFPRISIVVIVEIFSYFFLRLYKSSLDEIKYFQNEATNIESRFLALDLAVSMNDESSIKMCVDRLSSTERNPVLLRGQSNEVLQKSKSLERSVSLSPEYIAQIIKAINSKARI